MAEAFDLSWMDDKKPKESDNKQNKSSDEPKEPKEPKQPKEPKPKLPKLPKPEKEREKPSDLEEKVKRLEDQLKRIEDSIQKPQPQLDTYNTRLQDLQIEQGKLQAQLAVLDKIKDIATKTRGEVSLQYYDSFHVKKWLKMTLKVDNIADKDLSSLQNQRKVIPNYDRLDATTLELFRLLSRTIRDGRILDLYIEIQTKMNEKK